MILVGSHVIPATVVWAGLAAALALLPANVFVVVAIGYGLAHGVAETTGLALRAPGVGWEVPSSWLRGRHWTVRALVWGTTLGPGLITRNPYAGMWFIPLLLATTGSAAAGAAAGVLVGIVHATARAGGVLANYRHRASCELPWRMMITHMRFRRADGVGLLFAAAVMTAVFWWTLAQS